jgi:biopolymer transport protein ExbD
MEFKSRRKKDVHLDITPVVDTVFNLMLFFAVSLNFASTPAALTIRLPEIDSQAYPADASLPAIVISDAGEIRLNHQPVPLRDLASHLLHLHDTRTSDHILIQADARAMHGTVVTVMDICQSSGFQAISIAAHPAAAR